MAPEPPPRDRHLRRPGRTPGHLKEAVLSYAVASFLADLKGQLLAYRTIAAKKTITTVMIEQLGPNFRVWQLTREILTNLVNVCVAPPTATENAARVAAGKKGRALRTGRTSKEGRSQVRSTIKQFVEHCHNNRWLDVAEYLPKPISNSKKKDPSEKPRPAKVRYAEEHWDPILDLAEQVHPRCRIATALGFTGRRASEATLLQWKDIDWETGAVRCWNLKMGRDFQVPVQTLVMEREVRRWLAWLTCHYGPIQPHWYVVPGKRESREVRGPGSKIRAMRGPARWPLVPDRQTSVSSIDHDNLKLLTTLGYGRHQGVGTHTWRRSAATVVAEKYGIGAAQALLDHESPATTQIYTGNNEGKAMLWAAFAPGRTPPGGFSMYTPPKPLVVVDDLPDNVHDIQSRKRRRTA